MKLVFADTGAFYALVDRHDPAHHRARAYYRSYKGWFVTTDYVFAETMSLVTKRLGKTVAIDLGRAVRDSRRLRIEEVTAVHREQAWELFSGHTDKEYDLIDCISFSVMRTLGIHEAFGFDRHYLQHGLTLLPH